jgi:hypothetical protein
MSLGWIGVDLDGTLAHYDGWKGEDQIGPPIVPMVNRVKKWLDEGQDVRIFTARTGNGQKSIDAVQAWCEEHLGKKLPVTATKDFSMTTLYDDRAIQVQKNTGRLIGGVPQ